jgi:hypothetical protein
MKAGAVAVVVFCVVGFGFGQYPQAQGGLTPAEIEEAIAFGATHEPEPYLLRHAGSENAPLAVGAVYTPFLRVVFQARAAARQGERLTPSDVTGAMAAPLAYIAFRWYCCDRNEAPELAAVVPQVLMFREPARSTASHPGLPFSAMPRRGVKPVWLMQGSEYLQSFGAEPPFDDVVFVAAYPLDVLTPLRTFAIFKRWETDEVPGPVSGMIRYGVVRAADAARWR